MVSAAKKEPHMITLASMGISDRKQQHNPLPMAVSWVLCVILYAGFAWGYQSFTLYNNITRLDLEIYHDIPTIDDFGDTQSLDSESCRNI